MIDKDSGEAKIVGFVNFKYTKYEDQDIDEESSENENESGDDENSDEEDTKRPTKKAKLEESNVNSNVNSNTKKEKNDYAYIEYLSVIDTYRSTNIGTALVAAVVDSTKELDLDSVQTASSLARNYWRKLGFCDGIYDGTLTLENEDFKYFLNSLVLELKSGHFFANVETYMFNLFADINKNYDDVSPEERKELVERANKKIGKLINDKTFACIGTHNPIEISNSNANSKEEEGTRSVNSKEEEETPQANVRKAQ